MRPNIAEGAHLRPSARSAVTPTGRPGAGPRRRSTRSTGGPRRASAPHRLRARCCGRAGTGYLRSSAFRSRIAPDGLQRPCPPDRRSIPSAPRRQDLQRSRPDARALRHLPQVSPRKVASVNDIRRQRGKRPGGQFRQLQMAPVTQHLQDTRPDGQVGCTCASCKASSRSSSDRRSLAGRPSCTARRRAPAPACGARWGSGRLLEAPVSCGCGWANIRLSIGTQN